MLNLRKQIRTLYITGVLGNLSLTGAWVVILAARGFSLVQIGFAETVFHIVSLICEIPSGMLADMYGRKKMLVLGNLMAITGDIVMFLSQDYFMVLLSMPFHAMAYNFASGSGEALAYGLGYKRSADGGIHTSGERQQHLAVRAHLPVDLRELLVYEGVSKLGSSDPFHAFRSYV